MNIQFKEVSSSLHKVGNAVTLPLPATRSDGNEAHEKSDGIYKSALFFPACYVMYFPSLQAMGSSVDFFPAEVNAEGIHRDAFCKKA